MARQAPFQTEAGVHQLRIQPQNCGILGLNSANASVTAITAGAAANIDSVSGATSSWDDLYNAPSTITPIACYYADASFLTLAGSDVAAWPCAWSSGHDGTQAANRPSWDGTYVVFTAASLERMAIDYSTPVASGDALIVVGGNNAANAGTQGFIDWQTGRLAMFKNIGAGNLSYYDGAQRTTPGAASTGVHYWTFKMNNGAGAIREDGANLLAAQAYTQRALGGSAALGARYDGATNYLGFSVKFIAVYSGVDDTDMAAVELVAKGILGI